MEIKAVGVVGCGVMGGGIAQVCVTHGFATVVVEADAARLEAGLARVRAQLDRDVERGRLDRERHARALRRLQGSVELGALAGCDLVIEAVAEDLSAKRAVFAELGRVTRPDAVLASNTSSLSLSELAAASGRPAQVLGLHFFNPPAVLRLVEVVTTEGTAPAAVEAAMAFCDAIDRVTVRVQDTPGFIVNRLLVPFIFDAVRMVESGTAAAADVDQACRVGLAHAMGPLATADLIGLDVLCQIGEVMFAAYGEPRFKPPALLRRMVALGQLGRKTGAGFFPYAAE